jgi:hypothetical protein
LNISVAVSGTMNWNPTTCVMLTMTTPPQVEAGGALCEE